MALVKSCFFLLEGFKDLRINKSSCSFPSWCCLFQPWIPKFHINFAHYDTIKPYLYWFMLSQFKETAYRSEPSLNAQVNTCPGSFPFICVFLNYRSGPQRGFEGNRCAQVSLPCETNTLNLSFRTSEHIPCLSQRTVKCSEWSDQDYWAWFRTYISAAQRYFTLSDTGLRTGFFSFMPTHMTVSVIW